MKIAKIILLALTTCLSSCYEDYTHDYETTNVGFALQNPLRTVNTQADGRRFYGYLNKWNWMSYYGHADYTYNNLVQASVNVSVDGASSTGTSANRFYVYPSAGVTLLGKGWKPLQNSAWINKLNVRAEYSLTNLSNNNHLQLPTFAYHHSEHRLTDLLR